MLRAIDIVSRIAPHANDAYVRAFADGDALLAGHELTTPLRLSHFLAQALHETGRGTVLWENMAYSAPRILAVFGVGNHSAAVREEEAAGLAYNPPALAERVYGLGNPHKAAELGNAQPGDGYKYRGGGVLQTTGRANYRRMGQKCGVDFEGQPELVVAPAHALEPALQEWTEGNLNAAADRNDIATITRVINGGYNGAQERKDLFDQIWAIAAPDAPAWQSADAHDDTAWLQKALNTLGASPPLTVDGKTGPATVSAVKWFQGLAGLTADGVAGEITRAAIRQRLAA